jgi:hypothetical protein
MLSPADLANTVTAYATILSGLVALALTALVQRQPLRWVAVYAGVVLTGIATVWYHGFGEQTPAAVADIGTNLLLAWLMQMAVLSDYYGARTRRWIGTAFGVPSLAYVVWKAVVGVERSRVFAVAWGESSGFYIGEALLIAGSLLAVGLVYLRLGRVPARARPLWYLATGMFLFGTLLATASNQQVGLQILAYHATWHLVSAFGFIVIWAFNHVRFSLCPQGK